LILVLIGSFLNINTLPVLSLLKINQSTKYFLTSAEPKTFIFPSDVSILEKGFICAVCFLPSKTIIESIPLNASFFNP
jgi:hypothetical protein